jgi:hypothetical protein
MRSENKIMNCARASDQAGGGAERSLMFLMARYSSFAPRHRSGSCRAS